MTTTNFHPLLTPHPASLAHATFGWGRGGGNAGRLTISSITTGKQAEEGGVQVGWTIAAVNGVRVTSEPEFKAIVAGVKRSVPYTQVSGQKW